VISIKIEGLERTLAQIGNAGKQARYATAVALTRTAQAVEKRLKSDMERVFDNPSPWIKRGTYMKRADKATLTAEVGVQARQALYVKESFMSGARGQKPYEKALAGMGALPSGYRAVPGAGLKLDARGIPNRKQLSEMFGSLASRMQVYKGRGKRAKLTGYFVVPVGASRRLAAGVWWRSGRAVKPILIFVRQAGYRKVLDLPRSAREVVNAEFARLFDAALAQAMRSAR
jgi:hypothetical protein